MPFARVAVVAAELCAALCAAASLPAQIVRGIVLLPDSSRAAGVIVMATGERSAPIRALTGERGDYELRLLAPGRYEIRVLRIGYRPTVAPPFDIAAGEVRSLPIVLNGEAIVLAAIKVAGKSICRVQKDSGEVVAHLWAEAQKAITATQLSSAAAKQQVRWKTFERLTDLSAQTVLSESHDTQSANAMKAFVSLPPDSLARFGYVTEDPAGTIYRAPDADALISDQFASLHCFRVEPPTKTRADWVGIGFKPAKDRNGITDISGTLWLDRTSSELRLLEYQYTNLPDDYSHYSAGGNVEFMRLSTGAWLVNRWSIRMPRGTRRIVPVYNTTGGARDEYKTVVDGLQFTGGEVISVQRGQEVLFSAGASAHDFSPLLLAEDAKLAGSCSSGNGPLSDLFALLRGNVFEGEHKAIANAAVRLTWRGEFRSAGQNVFTYQNETRDLSTNAAGDFWLCGVPRERIITVRATIGGRTSAPVTVRIPKERPSAGVDVLIPPE